MAKNPQKYKYLEVGLAWGSWTLEQLTADAELHQMPDQLSKLAALRLTEYYRLVALGVIVPGVTALQKPTEHEVRAASNGTAHRSNSTTEETETTRKLKASGAANQDQNILLEESCDVDANAAAALAFFADEEDEDEPATDA